MVGWWVVKFDLDGSWMLLVDLSTRFVTLTLNISKRNIIIQTKETSRRTSRSNNFAIRRVPLSLVGSAAA